MSQAKKSIKERLSLDDEAMQYVEMLNKRYVEMLKEQALSHPNRIESIPTKPNSTLQNYLK